MKGLSSKARVTFGLVGLAVSALLMAAMLELLPDPISSARASRATLAEVLASSSSGWVEADSRDRAEETLRLAVERNEDLMSVAMRRLDGSTMLEVGDHSGNWVQMQGAHSNDTQIRVPILTGERRWGSLELRFQPLLGDGVLGLLTHPLVLLVGFMAVSCFFSFYFYLSKALTQLDPGKAVPGRVRSALDTMAEGLLVIDRSGRIVLANRAFSSLVGQSPEDLVGTEPASLEFGRSQDEGESAVRFPWIRALETGEEEYGIPMRLRDATGEQRALMVNCSPVMGASGKPGGVLVSFDDVTELEARGEELREAKDEADQANRAKSEFLANMSHEIRTPMNAILGFTDVLRRGQHADPQASQKHLNTIHSSGTQLLNLINDILDLSKVESGHMEVESVPMAPYRLVGEVLNVLNVRAEEKGVGLTYEPIGPHPETVLSDPVRLRQIITNLVGNAIKFTDSGGVRVTSWLDQDGAEPVMEIQVHDSGIGIADDKLETVFEAFAQADASVTRNFGGTGLGLPISRKFARAMGGDITVASVPGEGSTFTLRLGTGPLDDVKMLSAEEVAAMDDEAVHVEVRTWRFDGARVLVVDDAPENRSLLEVVLEDTGLTLLQAENGAEALDVAARERPDLILMDMQMPVMDGYTATRTLRERGFTVPVVALTAHAMQGYEIECRAAGCDDFVTKPIDIDVLMEAMARWLPQHAHEVENKQPAEAPPSAVTSAEAGGVADGPARAAAPLELVQTPVAAEPALPVQSSLAGQPRMHAVVRMFAVRLEQRLEALTGAEELTELAEMAHWLKGSAGTVGYASFTKPAEVLERLARAGDASGAADALEEVRALAARMEIPGEIPGEVPDPAPEKDVREPGTTRNTSPAPEPKIAATGEPLVSSLAGNARMHRVIRMFAERLEQRLDTVTGVDDLDDLADMAHWLKGSAGTVGYGDFTGPAQQLENCARSGDAAGAAAVLVEVRGLAARVAVPGEEAARTG